MKSFKKAIALLTLAAVLGSTAQTLSAQEYYVDSGTAYEESSNTSSYTPYIALGAIAAVAIVAICVSNSGHRHHSGHSSGSSN
jgi:hypothetical protein